MASRGLTDRARRPCVMPISCRTSGDRDRPADAGEATLGRPQAPRAAAAPPGRRCPGRGQKGHPRSPWSGQACDPAAPRQRDTAFTGADGRAVTKTPSSFTLKVISRRISATCACERRRGQMTQMIPSSPRLRRQVIDLLGRARCQPRAHAHRRNRQSALRSDLSPPHRRHSTRWAERSVARHAPINAEIYGNPLQCRTNCGTKQHSAAAKTRDGQT
jgi:hypothetical protein